MATIAPAIDQSASSKAVDASLWWDSFTVLLTELENVSLSLDIPPHVVKKLEDNHEWFLRTVSHFKPPNQKSREALNSKQVEIGSHQLTIQPELKDAALRISDSLYLDEVQSYILIERSVEHNNLPVNFLIQEFLHVVLLQYYIERQCLLKCTRQILMLSLYIGISSNDNYTIGEEALKLISDGLEGNLFSLLQSLLSSSHPKHMEVDFYTLWAEETLIEDSLILDILFLAYYESLCTCTAEQWKKLCLLYEGIITGSFNFGRLALSPEAIHSAYQSKIQLLLILIKTLDLEKLLQMIHDEVPFRPGSTAFSLTDIQEMDAIISSFNAFETKEAGPLILTWAVFLCLLSSLPQTEENNMLMEIDHVGYVRQAFEGSSLSYFLEILQSDILKDSDEAVAGYRSVLRTFISAFIASYDVLQLEDVTYKLILDILCKIYRGEEALCNQFWDRDSYIDEPIRCLLRNLEAEFPIRTAEFVRFLSALSEGTWPAECVYNFLDKSVGISTLFEISSNSLVDSISQIVETQLPLHVPGVEGLFIPSKTRGHILKVNGGNTALVRWEHAESGLFVLLLRLAQDLYLDSNEEILLTLDLLCRLVSFNMAVCFALMGSDNSLSVQATHMNGQMEKSRWCRVNLVEIICNLVGRLSSNCNSAVLLSMSIKIIAKMLKCSPSLVTAVALKENVFDVSLKTNILDVGFSGLSSGSQLLSGKLAKMLLIDSEQNDDCCPLTISVLDYTMQLMETGVESDVVLALVVFSLQYVFVNHEYWKYKVKHVRWKVTLKALEVIKECILSIPYSQKVGEVVKVILLRDSSIHNTLFRVICTTPQALEKCYVSRFYEPVEIEGLELAICSVLDILFTMLSKLSKDISSSVPVFHQSVLSSTAKPNPIVAAVISLISYFRNSAIQLASARVISMLFTLADFSQPYLFGNACFGLDDNQITDLRHSVNKILCEHSLQDEELFVAVVRLLTSAARYQPAFLLAMVAVKENMDGQQSNTGGEKEPINKPSFLPLGSKKGSLIDILLQYVVRSDDLIDSNPRILLNMLNFLKALWQGAAQYADILEQLKNSGKFWKQLSNSILLIASIEAPQRENHIDNEALARAYKYQCQCSMLELMAYDMFLEKKLLDAELLVNQAAESSKEKIGNALSTEKSKSANGHDLKDIVSSWCENSVLGNLMKSYASCEYDNEICIRAKVAVSLFSVHVMGKLATGDAGSLSVSLIEMIRIMEKKLSSLPAFSELKTKYSQHGYSDGTEPNTLILSDLYYHLQGEFAGRKIAPGPFKELSQFLFESKLLQNYQHKYDGDLFPQAEDLNLFDTTRLKKDLGLEMWDHSKWKVSKAIAEEMLLCMEEANSMVLLSTSRLSALKALENLFAVSEEDSNKKSETCEKLIVSSIDHICNCFRATLESIAQILDPSEHILGFLEAQVELLLQLTRSVQKHLSLPVCILVLKTSGFGLKVLSDLNQSVSGVKTTMKILLMLLLSSVEFSYLNSHLGEGTDQKSVEVFSEVSNVSLALLPVLCNCSKTSEHCTLSLTAMDLILKGFSTPNTWFPIIQKHFQLQHVILKLQDKMSLDSVPIILKFLLTLARVRVGAEMLLTSGFFFSLRVLFADSVNDSTDKTGKPQNIWGLGLAVVTAMICSLGDTSSCIDIVDSVIPYFFLEKAFLISYYLNAPDFPSDDHDKKRARSQRSQTSLSTLKETEQTLLLMCVLAKHWNSWAKAMKEMDSQLRERSIHLLAFISRGNQRVGESRAAPLLCPPILKEEFDYFKKPSFVNSRNGWFAHSPLGCRSKPKVFTVLNKTSALVVTENSQTYFSDIIALQIYRIAFLVLKFLCLQAEGAAKRAEEVGFVDLAHFPELPMPEILHGLQDQAITIVTELCEANKAKQIEPEIQTICGLLLKIMEMSLHLELCVSQICGIRPVLGRVEDFSKSVKFLLKAMEGQVFLKASVKSLKQIMGLVYPGLLHSDGFL